jgi:hypothetical protein
MKTVLVLDLLYYDVHPTVHKNGVTPTALEEASVLAAHGYRVIFGCAGSNLNRLKKAYPEVEFVNLFPQTYASMLDDDKHTVESSGFSPTVAAKIKEIVINEKIWVISCSSMRQLLKHLEKVDLPCPVVYTMHFWPQPNLMFHASTVGGLLAIRENPKFYICANTEFTMEQHLEQSRLAHAKGLIRGSALAAYDRFEGNYSDSFWRRMTCSDSVPDIPVCNVPSGRLIVASRTHKAKNPVFCSASPLIDFHLLVYENPDKDAQAILDKMASVGASVQRNTPQVKLYKLMARSSGVVVSCTFETFARTSFEAACSGVPSLVFVDKTGKHAVHSWSQQAGVQFDSFRFADLKDRKNRFKAAVEHVATGWSYEERLELKRRVRSYFSAKNFVAERTSAFKAAWSKMKASS